MAASGYHTELFEETPATYYEETVKLPGYEQAPERCRPLHPVGFCESGHTVLGRSSCGTRYCPDHWPDWLERATIKIVERLAAKREAAEGLGKRVCHVVASPPQEKRYSVRELWETRTEAYEAFEAAGVSGGAVVTHPYRTNKRGDTAFETVREAGNVSENTGKWVFLRDMADGWEDMVQYIKSEPHYHALATGEDIDGSEAPDGWIVENIRSMRAFHYRDTEAYRDMARTVGYVLSHGAVQDGRATTTYFGEVHPNSFNPEEELTAAKWDTIQREAEKAVTEMPGEESEGHGHGPDECPRDGCEAVVRDLVHLPEYLDDEEWVGEIVAGRGGRDRLAELRGALAWWESRTDRPPPSSVTSKKRLREWLRERGESFVPQPHQVSLETALMA